MCTRRVRAYVQWDRPAPPRLVSLRPAWVGQLATDYIKTYNDTNPFFLKVSFHRPHSPYDPPARVYNETTTVFPPMALGNDWDRVFTGASGLGDDHACSSSWQVCLESRLAAWATMRGAGTCPRD